MLLNPFASGGFGVEVELYKLRIKENTPPDFAKGHRPVPLLVAQPAKAGTAGFIEKNLKKLVSVNIACRRLALFLCLRWCCIHVINCA